MKLRILKPKMQMLPDRVRTLTDSPNSWRTKRMGSTERLYSYAWQKARERFLRDNPLCVYCRREGLIRAASIVDHKIPHRGDETLFWDETNWQPMCKPHHDSDKQREERGGNPVRRIGLDGWPSEGAP